MKRLAIFSAFVIVVLGVPPKVLRAEPPVPKAFSLHIIADIDGSDRLSISQREIFWLHRHWDWPNLVKINHVEWSPRLSPTLGENAKNNLMDAPIDFSSARMTVRQGRDTAVLEKFDDHLVIHFSDSPNGRAVYDLTITFDPTDAPHKRRKRADAATKTSFDDMVQLNERNPRLEFRYFNDKVFVTSLLQETLDGLQRDTQTGLVEETPAPRLLP